MSLSLYSVLPETVHSQQATEATRLCSQVITAAPSLTRTQLTPANPNQPQLIQLTTANPNQLTTANPIKPQLTQPTTANPNPGNHNWNSPPSASLQVRYREGLKLLQQSLYHQLPETSETQLVRQLSELQSQVTHTHTDTHTETHAHTHQPGGAALLAAAQVPGGREKSAELLHVLHHGCYHGDTARQRSC